MTDVTPNSPIDVLTQEVRSVQDLLRRINDRLDSSDRIFHKLLQSLKISEETFELRVAKAQVNLYAGLTHSLEHSIEDLTSRLRVSRYGFEVAVVDGVNVLETPESILVTKRQDGYDFSRATEPTVIDNTGGDPLVRYFDENPEVFGGRESIVINVFAEVTQNG